MEIPLQAQVRCTDGVSGKSVYVVIDPIDDRVTHVVIQENSPARTEYLVPIDMVSQSVDGTLLMHCSRAELQKMEQFVHTTFIEQKFPEYAGYAGYGSGDAYYMPYVLLERRVNVPVSHQHIPKGESAVRRGARVTTSAGKDVGQVDEFVIDPETKQITHLVMREGNFWGKRDVIIPVTAIENIKNESVCLNLTQEHIEELPDFPVKRRWL